MNITIFMGEIFECLNFFLYFTDYFGVKCRFTSVYLINGRNGHSATTAGFSIIFFLRIRRETDNRNVNMVFAQNIPLSLHVSFEYHQLTSSGRLR